MDVHVPLAITRGLRRRGVDVLTAQEDGRSRALDSELLDRAYDLGRMLFSQDEDLISEAVRRQRDGQSFATVVLVRQIDQAVGRCIADLDSLCKAATANGPLEGLNNRIQGLIKKAIGYRNKERFKTDVLFHLGGLDLYPVQ